jgi:hypothetical protein
MRLPELDDLITVDELRDTGAGIAEWQLPSGMIPWFPGGHADPWNHIEAAMALDVAGFHDEAIAAYEWLIRNQRSDGAWHQYYLADSIEQDKLDANCVAYVATGAWHHYLVSNDHGFLQELWPVVESAVDFVLGLQQPRGEIRWARHADGTPWSFALLTGSSSVCHSLRAAIAIAEHLGHERPDWELSAARLAHVIRTEPNAFAPKNRWAMDWYYPVISGALSPDEASDRLADRRDEFVIEGRGIRCVSDRAWVTAAETCEATLAYLCVGDRSTAIDLFAWSQELRDTDGRYWTGRVFPQEVQFPADEKSTYTAAAVILAADALAGASPAARLFTDHEFLPALIGIDDQIDQPSLD